MLYCIGFFWGGVLLGRDNYNLLATAGWTGGCVFTIIHVLIKFCDFDWVTTQYTRMLLVSSTGSFTRISERKNHVEPIICLVLNGVILIWFYPILMYTDVHWLVDDNIWIATIFLWMEFPLIFFLIIHIDITLYKTFQRVTLSYEITTFRFRMSYESKMSHTEIAVGFY